jgi:asparagine synthase (glutamine-hydrolysing)
MSYLKNRYWITYNGEVYNYKELRDDLIKLGHSFSTKSDTEVIIASYIQWGVDCLNRFNGMWAFTIYDTVLNEIFMSRDRFGIKPFYYWFSPEGCFAFASEIKQFTEVDGWSAKINPQRAYDYLVYSITDHTDECMFDGVFQIPGGYYFKANINEIKPGLNKKIPLTKWYEIEDNKFNGSFESAAAEFNRLFKDAINLHLRSDVPVGSALSGGLDSSAIVCEIDAILRSKGLQHRKKTFTSCSDFEKYDERKWVEIVGANTSIETHYVYPDCKDLFKMINSLTWQHDEPFQSLSPYLGFHVFQLAAQNGIKVLFNGQGADEYLGGYRQFAIPRYMKMFRKLQWLKLIREIIHTSKSYPLNLASLLKMMLHSLVPLFIRRKLGRRIDRYSGIKNLINKKSLRARPLHPYDEIPLKKETVPQISKHLTFFSTLPRYLKWEDRNSMANSVEARVPFLDYRLVEFCYNLPDDYLDFKGENKRILREGLKGILPEEIRCRKDKMGFSSPEEEWVKVVDPGLFRSKLKEAVEISEGIIKPEAIEYFEKIIAGELPFDFTYWRLIQFAEWMKIYILKKDVKTSASLINTLVLYNCLNS